MAIQSTGFAGRAQDGIGETSFTKRTAGMGGFASNWLLYLPLTLLTLLPSTGNHVHTSQQQPRPVSVSVKRMGKKKLKIYE
jgi:hypothetical protein